MAFQLWSHGLDGKSTGIANVKHAVIWQSGGTLLARTQLSTAAFSIASGNTLTLVTAAGGVFELN
jgi:hypothetical protein